MLDPERLKQWLSQSLATSDRACDYIRKSQNYDVKDPDLREAIVQIGLMQGFIETIYRGIDTK